MSKNIITEGEAGVFLPHKFTEEQIKKLFYRLTQSTESLLYDSNNKERNRYNLYQYHNPILGVAHCDYVSEAWSYPQRKRCLNADCIVAGQVDDRVGIWILLDILPNYLDFDVLLTTDEEIGRSTSQDVMEPLPYNWTFQFDRRGTDVVDYGMASPEMKELFSIETGIDFGQGSFSDICWLSEESGSKLNIGTGYHNEHTPDAYVNLNECYSQVMKFLKFSKKYQYTRFEQPEDMNIFYNFPNCFNSA